MKFLYFIFISSVLIPLSSFGANSLDVVINEAVWMGTEMSSNDEWIELYNNTSAPIDISGWTLKAEDGSPEITLNGTIPALGYFLLERTDDKTLPDVSADQIYTGSLENIGEKLELRDNNNLLIDIVDCSNGWFAGDNTTKQTMERKNPKAEGNIAENWRNSRSAGGTPKAKSSTFQQPTPTASPTPAASPSPMFPPAPTPSPTPQISPSIIPSKTEPDKETTAPINIFADFLKISEFIPNPAGNDEENEWIEVYSDSDEKLDVSNWKLKSNGKTYTTPEQTFISPNEFLVLSIKATGLTLKNSDSALELYYPNGALAQKIDYQETKESWSISKIGSEYLWTNNPTPGLANKASSEKIESAILNISEPKTPSPNPTQSPQTFSEEKNENPPNEISLISPTEKQKSPVKNWLAIIGIIIFGFFAGLGLVKIRKEG